MTQPSNRVQLMPVKARAVTPKRAGLGVGVVAILSSIFALEGGYVNNPKDPGGETNHGITVAVARKHGYTGTMRDLPRWCPDALNAMIADAEAGRRVRMVKPCADTILFVDYLERPKLLPLVAIDAAVAEEVADTATNMGPARPARFFQRAVNATCRTSIRVDGQIGPATTAAWAQCREQLGRPACILMLKSLDDQQRAEYDRLVRRNPSLRVFYRGWINHRIGNVKPEACV
jgi:lysozyme family protein